MATSHCGHLKMDKPAQVYEPDNFIKEKLEELKQYDFNFTNIVFEGGGAKGGAYLGVVKVLDELGILKKVTRFAGTSVGSATAMLVAIGMDIKSMEEALSANFQPLIEDNACAKCLFLTKIWSKFGLYKANKFTDYLRVQLKKQTGQDKMTFAELYAKRGVELCILGSNLSTRSIEYFHPKTTPDFDIVTAVRLSSSLPGMMQPVQKFTSGKMTEYWVDGGLLCNFPVHVFDGWYLSMSKENMFLKKLGDDKKFQPFNPATLGFLLTSAGEEESGDADCAMKQTEYSVKIVRPNTKIAKERAAKCDEILAKHAEKDRMYEAGKMLYEELMAHHDEESDVLCTKDQFVETFKEFQRNHPEQAKLMFGEIDAAEEALKVVDVNKDNTVSLNEFMKFVKTKGVKFLEMVEGSTAHNISNIFDFGSSAWTTINLLTKQLFRKEEDMYRTSDLYVDYIKTSDFSLNPEDMAFLTQQGMVGCLRHIFDMVTKHERGELPHYYDHIILKRHEHFM